jgi:plasmid stability protein
MPSLSIKNVPEEVIERLRVRAERNHRSLQRELLALVCDAVTEGSFSGTTVPDRQVPARRGTKSVREIYEEHRASGLGPFPDAPLAVDIIRADRDSR